MWEKLVNAQLPIVLYGTGNAAEKIIAELHKRNIAIAGIFASDGFVRSRSFAGYPVLSYSEAKACFGKMIVLLCFGSHLKPVIDNIKLIDDEQIMYAPDLPIAGAELFTEEYKRAHLKDIMKAEAMLADAQSRKVFRNVIDYKLTGHINFLLDCETDDDENWALLGLGAHEKYLDLGAYNGDTVARFLAAAGGRYDSITAVEPEQRNFRKLGEYVSGFASGAEVAISVKSDTDNQQDLGAKLVHANIELVNNAVGDSCKTVMFTKNTGRGGQVGKGKTYPVEMTTVDLLLDGRDVSFIKMDLEGQEPFAIDGAAETIRRCKPKMLVSAYHRSDDLWALPLKIKELNPGYKFYLRKSPCLPAWEVNYYIV